MMRATKQLKKDQDEGNPQISNFFSNLFNVTDDDKLAIMLNYANSQNLCT